MIEDFKHEGIWWLPNKSDYTIHGTLNYSSLTSATLKLHDPAYKRIDDFFNDSENIFEEKPIILGLLNNGSKITLNGCNVRNTSSNFCELSIDWVFIGIHFEEVSDIKFTNISVNFSSFEEWIDLFIFNLKFSDKNINIEYLSKHTFQAKINNYTINLNSEFRTLPTLKEFTIKQISYVTVEVAEEIQFENILEILSIFQKFLRLASSEWSYPLYMWGQSEKNKRKIGKNEYNPTIEIFGSGFNVLEVKNKKPKHKMLFTFQSIANDFQRFMSTWSDIHERLEPVINLLLEAITTTLYSEQMFLSLARAIESYHSMTTNNKSLDTNEYFYRMAYLVSASPPEWREWLRMKLYSNEPSLRNRLRDSNKINELKHNGA